MGTRVFDYVITKEDACYNLGGLVELHLEKAMKSGANNLLVKTCNQYFYGSYLVPNAIGFSTPVFPILIGAQLIFCSSEDDGQLHENFESWKKVYLGKPIRQITEKKFLSSDIECSICLENYIEGDNLLILDCDHRYHSQCFEKWIINQCSVCKNFKFNSIKQHNSHNSYLIQNEKSTTCALCNKNCNI
jgi:hypothetical protein